VSCSSCRSGGADDRVEETYVRDRIDTPKSDASERTVALGPVVADQLFEHRARSAFAGDDVRVFCHPETGGPLSAKEYAATFRLALAKAKITKPVRPFHDGRHGHLTNAAAAGVSPAALQARAGHADMSTTQRYIDLAGVRFREEAELAEARMFGSSSAPALVAAVAEEEQRHEHKHHKQHRGGND
jgi:integrase